MYGNATYGWELLVKDLDLSLPTLMLDCVIQVEDLLRRSLYGWQKEVTTFKGNSKAKSPDKKLVTLF